MIFSAGSEAKQVFEDAQQLLKMVIRNGSLKGQGVVGFWHAQSNLDDIHVYKDDISLFRDAEPIATFHCLRQQVRFFRSLRMFDGFSEDENTSVLFPTAGEGQLCVRAVPVSV